MIMGRTNRQVRVMINGSWQLNIETSMTRTPFTRECGRENASDRRIDRKVVGHKKDRS